jgi:hypothetical protein
VTALLHRRPRITASAVVKRDGVHKLRRARLPEYRKVAVTVSPTNEIATDAAAEPFDIPGGMGEPIHLVTSLAEDDVTEINWPRFHHL